MLEGIPPAAKPSRTAGSPVEYLGHRLHQRRETRKADLLKHFVRACDRLCWRVLSVPCNLNFKPRMFFACDQCLIPARATLKHKVHFGTKDSDCLSECRMIASRVSPNILSVHCPATSLQERVANLGANLV